MLRDAVVVFVLIVAVPLHANTRRQGQVAVGITVQPGHIPGNAIAVVQRIAGQRRTQESVLSVMNVAQTRHHGGFAAVQLAHLRIVAVARLEIHRRPVSGHGQFVVGIIPQVVATTQTVEPEVIAFITNDRYRVNICIILFIRMLDDAHAGPQR